MDILKLKKKKLKSNISRDIIEGDILTKSKCIVSTQKNSFLEINPYQYVVSPNFYHKNKTIYLSYIRKYQDQSLITTNLSKKVYKLYINHFFNYIIRNKIHIIKGRICKFKKKNLLSFLGINGGMFFLTAKNHLIESKKRSQFLKLKKMSLKPITIFCTDIKITQNTITLTASRQKYLKILKHFR